MPNDTNIKIKHSLRQARQRSGLEQKQVAALLGKKNANQISRYENGERMPGLLTVIKLEIIYHTPIKILLQALFEEYQTEINRRKKENRRLFPQEDWFLKPNDALKQEEFCFYAEIIKDRKPSEIERQMINKHVISLIKTINETD